MGNIRHYPLMNFRKYEKEYSELNECSVNYVCTTELGATDVPVDIYYQEFPHPKFGNQYFGLYYHPIHNTVRIMNGDSVMEKNFGLVENDLGELEYSKTKSDEKVFSNGNMISGGRAYIKSNGDVKTFIIQNGRFIETARNPRKI